MILKKTGLFLFIVMIFFIWIFSGKFQIYNFSLKVNIVHAVPLITYVGGTSGTGTASTYNVDLTNLTGGSDSAPQEGDIVIVVTGWASTANGDPGVTTSGYEELADQIGSDTRDANGSVNWKIMGSTPDTSVTVRGFNNAANGGATVVHVWRGVDQTDPFDVAGVFGVTSNSALVNSGAITAITPGAVLIIAGIATGDSTPVTQTVPANFTNEISVAGTGTTMSTVANIASRYWPSDTIDSAAWGLGETSTSDSFTHAALALRPAEIVTTTITYVGGTSGTGTTSTYDVDLTNLTGGSDSAPQEGDIVIVVTGWASTANGDPGVTTSGYEELADQIGSDTRDANGSVNWKIMGSTPDTSVTVRGFNNAANGGATVVHVWRGVDQTTPIDVTTTVEAFNNSSLINSPNIVPVTTGNIVLSVGVGTGDTTPVAQNPPGSFSNAVSVAGTGTTMSAVAGAASILWLDELLWPNAWKVGETSTSDSSVAATIALRPASVFTQSAYRFFENDNSTDVGTALNAQDTAGTLVSTGDAFRLRTLIHVTGAQLASSGQNFKLQFAEKSGTCDTGFSGETYADVTGATVIAYNNNATPADGDNLTANANDPTHSGHTIVNQDYEEANNFTNTVAAIPVGQDGKWDFSLIDNGATANTSYCFRIVKSDDSELNTYSVIPEIITASGGGDPDPTLSFSISDNSIGFGTLSSSAARYATGDLVGSASETEAHTISASTNGDGGYVITINGNTLTSGSNTIDAIGSSNTASSAGTEQFGLRMTATGGNGSVSAPYADTGFALDAASFPDVVASDVDGDDVETVYSVRYIGNISGTTEAGSYSSTITYVITASF